MKPTPWLEKEDEVWAQTVKWNAAREIFLECAGRGYLTYIEAKACPLIEEAVWFLKTCDEYPDGKYISSKLRLAAKTDSRAQLYVAIADKDRSNVRELALAGNPIAQGNVFPENFKEEISWLLKSMHGGYSEAFNRLAEIYDATNQRNAAIEHLIRGIEMGSIEAMLLYGKISPITPREKIYWDGRAWLEKIHQVDYFTDDCRWWHADYAVDNSVSEGFIYGHIFERAGRSFREGMRNDGIDSKTYVAISAAHNMYIQMTSKTRQATYQWILIGKQLGVVKDIVNLISKLIWRSRDQVRWFASSS